MYTLLCFCVRSGLVTGAVHVTTDKRHACIPMTHFSSSPSGEWNVVAVELHGKWTDNKPHWASKVAEYGDGLSNLSGAITHTFTLMMDLDHVSETPPRCSPWNRTGGKLCSFAVRSERKLKGQLRSPTSFKINQRSSQLYDRSHRAHSKGVLHMTTEMPDQRVPSWQWAQEC